MAHSAVQISNLNNSANSEQNLKRIWWSKQEPKWGRLMNTTGGQNSHATVPLKVQLCENFCFKLVWLQESAWAPDEPGEVFLILASNMQRYFIFHAFRVLSAYAKFQSTNYILRIISTWTISSRALSVHAKISFRVCLLYVKFLCTNYQHPDYLISRIISKCPGFSEIKHSFTYYPYTLNFTPCIIHMHYSATVPKD